MANLLKIVNRQQAPIDEEKLRIFCSKQNVWEHFGVAKDDLLSFPEEKQIKLIQNFYYDKLALESDSSAYNVESSIRNAVQNAQGLSMKKIIKNDRTEVNVDTVNPENNKKKCRNLWSNFRHFNTEYCDFSTEKANLPENTLFYVNQGYQSFKDNKKVYYNDIFIIAQIMPIAHHPKDIESYELKEKEVKFLRAKYDVVSGEFLGIEYCVGFITTRYEQDEQFFDYGYHKDNSKVLYSTRKLKIPNSFKTTIFGHHKTLYESGAFDEQEFSKLYFYLPQLSTETRKLISI